MKLTHNMYTEAQQCLMVTCSLTHRTECVCHGHIFPWSNLSPVPIKHTVHYYCDLLLLYYTPIISITPPRVDLFRNIDHVHVC